MAVEDLARAVVAVEFQVRKVRDTIPCHGMILTYKHGVLRVQSKNILGTICIHH